MMPLHLFCVQEGLAARVRLDGVLALGWHGTSHTKNHAISHLKYWETKLSELQIDCRSGDACNEMLWDMKYKVNMDSFSGESKHRRPTQYNIFTDGSRQNDRTGAGFVLYKGKTEICSDKCRLPDSATVFQAEITAVSRAAEMFYGMNIHGANYLKIFVDSQAAILALANNKVTSKAVLKARENLNQLAGTIKSLQILWIPAHKGHVGNERADVLAKEGAATDEDGRVVNIGQPSASVKMQIRQAIYSSWTAEWTNSSQANHARSFYMGPDANKAKYVYKLARLELGRFIRIITGHNNLSFFQAKLGYRSTDMCSLCKEGQETITHLMNDCPKLFKQRWDILAGERPLPDMRWSVRKLLDFTYVPCVNALFEGDWATNDKGGATTRDETELISIDDIL